jgi:hypothetical protein
MALSLLPPDAEILASQLNLGLWGEEVVSVRRLVLSPITLPLILSLALYVYLNLSIYLCTCVYTLSTCVFNPPYLCDTYLLNPPSIGGGTAHT